MSVDCDNQASLTDCFGITDLDELNLSMYQLMMMTMDEEMLPEKDKYMISKEGIDIIPANTLLSYIDINLVLAISREYIIKDK